MSKEIHRWLQGTPEVLIIFKRISHLPLAHLLTTGYSAHHLGTAASVQVVGDRIRTIVSYKSTGGTILSVLLAILSKEIHK